MSQIKTRKATVAKENLTSASKKQGRKAGSRRKLDSTTSSSSEEFVLDELAEMLSSYMRDHGLIPNSGLNHKARVSTTTLAYEQVKDQGEERKTALELIFGGDQNVV